MKINYLEYYNKNVDWRLERTYFKDLTLLVGASGVGKTRILDAINTVKKIAGGKGFFGIQWELGFTLAEGQDYKDDEERHLQSFKYFIDLLRKIRADN